MQRKLTTRLILLIPLLILVSCAEKPEPQNPPPPPPWSAEIKLNDGVVISCKAGATIDQSSITCYREQPSASPSLVIPMSEVAELIIRNNKFQK